jgi:uncharacterized membrane protein YebE (DUF533 family)
MKMCALMLAVGVAVTGCGWGLKRFDPHTVRQVEKTIAFETEDFAMTEAAWADGVMDEVERKSLAVRHESELDRLKSWLVSEEAKKTEDVK